MKKRLLNDIAKGLKYLAKKLIVLFEFLLCLTVAAVFVITAIKTTTLNGALIIAIILLVIAGVLGFCKIYKNEIEHCSEDYNTERFWGLLYFIPLIAPLLHFYWAITCGCTPFKLLKEVWEEKLTMFVSTCNIAGAWFLLNLITIG